MQLDLLTSLQTLLLPLALGAVVVGGLLLRRLGRLGRRPAPPLRPPPVPLQAPAPVARQAGPARPRQPAASPPPPTPLPTQPPQAALQPPPALPLRADLLLVDDSAVVRAKLRRLFEPAGYRITLAPDGEAALALLTQGRYKLLITDLEMPRLDGMGLVRAALALPACVGMPILAITGHEDLQAQLNQLGAVAGIYRKPWSDGDLLGHVQALAAPSLQPAEAALET